MARLEVIEQQQLVLAAKNEERILTEEVKILSSLQASISQEKFLSTLKQMQAVLGLTLDSMRQYMRTNEVQDLIYEHYNNQNEEYVRINESESALHHEEAESAETSLKVESKGVISKESLGASAKGQAVAVVATDSTALKYRSAGVKRSVSARSGRREHLPVLRFEKVQNALTSSDIERIFRQYAGSIRSGISHIKRSGTEISMGSLSMNLSKGTWIRHSSGVSGNIFGFVQEGASVSKRQSLEIIAELAGIRAESTSHDYIVAAKRSENIAKPL